MTHAPQALLAGEAAVPGPADAAERELHRVEGGEVVDGDAAGADPLDHEVEDGVGGGAEHRGAEAEGGRVGEG